VKKFGWLALVALLLVLGCEREEAADVIETIGRGATAAGGAAGTVPGFAPAIPALALVAAGCGIAAKLLRNKPKEEVRRVEETAKKVVVAPGFFGSRKNKLMAIGFILAGVLVFAQHQWDLPASIVASALGVIAVVTGANIKGVSDEDAAEKGNPSNNK
jgi:hypothetical protein